jgi:hypothetical protein
MAYEHKANSGSLFGNDKKEKETQPDWKGSALIGGVEYWLSGWGKEGRLGLKFERKDEKKPESKPVDKSYQEPIRDIIDEDSIPF